MFKIRAEPVGSPIKLKAENNKREQEQTPKNKGDGPPNAILNCLPWEMDSQPKALLLNNTLHREIVSENATHLIFLSLTYDLNVWIT